MKLKIFICLSSLLLSGQGFTESLEKTSSFQLPTLKQQGREALSMIRRPLGNAEPLPYRVNLTPQPIQGRFGYESLSSQPLIGTKGHANRLKFSKGPVKNVRSSFPSTEVGWTRMGKCDGKENLLQDVSLIAIITGAIGTVLSIYSSFYNSIVSNLISTLNAILSIAIGIPASIITFYGKSDPIIHAVANALSMLSFANTFYGIWSIDIGNQGLLLSFLEDFLGIFSLILSVVTGLPGVFDAAVFLGGETFGGEFSYFVRRYGCNKRIGDLEGGVVQTTVAEWIKVFE